MGMTNLISDDPYGIAGAIVVENGHVYVAGETDNGDRPLPVIWKDEAVSRLKIPERSHGSAIDIAVLKNNVYVIGEHNYDGKVTSVLCPQQTHKTKKYENKQDNTGTSSRGQSMFLYRHLSQKSDCTDLAEYQ